MSTDLSELVRLNAINQAKDAGASHVQASVLGELAVLMDFATKRVLVRQKRIAERLGLRWPETVTRAIPKLCELELLIDHDKGLRHKAHTYELLLDWSFSTVLAPPAPEPVAALQSLDTSVPKPVRKRGHKAGHRGRNRKEGYCNCCREHVMAQAGWMVKFEDGTENGALRCFCEHHVESAQRLARAHWPHLDDFPPAETIYRVAEEQMAHNIRLNIDAARGG